MNNSNFKEKSRRLNNVEYKINKKPTDRAYGSCNFENFQSITRAHKSRSAITFIRFPILSSFHKVNVAWTVRGPILTEKVLEHVFPYVLSVARKEDIIKRSAFVC